MVKYGQFEYTCRILLKIIGIDEKDVCFLPEEKFSVQVKGKDVHFSILNDKETSSLLDGSFSPKTYKLNIISREIPVFVPEDQNESPEGINIEFDIITLPFYLLSRKEEVNKPHDKFGRFRYEDSLSYKYGIIDYPIVDYYALLLAERIGFTKSLSHYESHRLLLTHDVDSLKRFDGFFGSAKSIIGGDLILRKSIKIALKSVKELFRVALGRPDPEIQGVIELLNESYKYNFHSELYFKGITTDERGNRYDISTIPESVFKQINEGQYAIGFHGDIGSSTNEAQFDDEKNHAEKMLKVKNLDCGRQHYLSFDAAKTPGIWEKSGIKYDSTLGFCDREGFMCGTCHEYPLYDLIHEQQLNVVERPLLIMDCTLRDYRKMTAKDAVDTMINYAEIVNQVNGQYVVLWHNGCTYRDWTEWYKKVYCLFLREYHTRYCLNDLRF